MNNEQILFIIKNLPFSLQANRNNRGNWFIGFNHQYNVYNGLSWNQKQCEDMLAKDITQCLRVINKYCPTLQAVEAKVALVSLMMDVGSEVLIKHDFFKKMLSFSQNREKLQVLFVQYAKINRVVCAKTLNKRIEEHTLFVNAITTQEVVQERSKKTGFLL